MTFPVVGSNIPLPYEISNSLRFNDGDSPYLSQTPSASNRRTFTISFWTKRGVLGTNASVFAQGGASNDQTRMRFVDSDSSIFFDDEAGGTTQARLITNRVFRDVSAWYHIVIVVNTPESTSSDRIKLYVNGVQETSFATATYPVQNHEMLIGTANPFYIGREVGGSYFDGYLAEMHFIDGQAKVPGDFGESDEDSGVWKPKIYEGTYGTNGFYLKFNNTGNMGEDSSGNDNTFTPTNLSGTTDVTTDTPTNNFATLNPLVINRWANAGTLSEGNTEIKWTTGDPDTGIEFSTMGVTSGKWYWEVKMPVVARAMVGVGYMQDIVANTNVFYDNNPSKGFALAYNGSLQYDATSTTYGSSFSNNDILQVALDMDNHLCWFGLNGTWQNSATQSEIENSTATNDATTKMGTQQNLNSGQLVFPFVIDPSTTGQSHFQMNFGNPAYSISSGNSDGNGYGNFEYSVPSGYLALCTQNLATELSPTIDDGSQYFNPKIYTGTGSATSITGVGFQPDFTWIKQRNNANNHKLMNSTAGSTKFLVSANTDAEGTDAQGITSFDSDGFSLGTSGSYNGSGGSYVSWNWLANGGTTSSNTDGSITSTVQVNTTAGFSIITYTGTGANATVGHGLGKAPTMTIHKRRDSTSGWLVYHQGYGATKYTQLNSTDATTTASFAWNDTEPTSSVISLGYAGGNNASGGSYVAYCFADVEGYSKFGSYTGNGSTDGPFIYTGFRPAWIMIKRTDGVGAWQMHDRTRETINDGSSPALKANQTDAEFSKNVDFLSNGIKIRDTSSDINGASGNEHIYMAFAENPFVTSGVVPVTAR